MVSIPIFLASDNNYAPFIATTIASICDNTKSFIDFYILDGGISEINKEKIILLKNKFDNFSIEFISIDTKKEFHNFPEVRGITRSMYNRFLIPTIKPNINKAIYSDVDVIVVDDIAKLYNEDLENYALGAVWEEFHENSHNISRKQTLKLTDSHKYFCSGIILIDCKKWRESSITEKLLELGKKHTGDLKWPDQDLLNIYFDNNYKKLSYKYCFVDPCHEFHKKKDFIIRHYTGDLKPWKIAPEITTELFPDTQLFWHYMSLTSFYSELKEQCTIKNNDDIRKIKISKLISKNNIRVVSGS